MNTRQYIISALASLLIMILAGIGYQKMKAQKKSTVSDKKIEAEINYVKTANFNSETVQSQISIDGRIVGYEKINIAAEVQGRLLNAAKSWRKGSYFTKGETLFEIDHEEEQLNLFAQRSTLLNAITQIMPDLKFDYPDAFQTWKNYLDNFDIERTTAKLPQVQSDQEKYYVAGKNIYNLYYAIKSAEGRMDDFQVKAPFNGVFLTLNAFPGSVVSPGASLGSLMNTSRYELETPISMKNLGLIKIGQKVSLEAEDLGKKFTGTIARISTQIDQTTQSLPVFISVSGKGLRDGLYLKGTLNGSSLGDVVTLPIEAIVNQNMIYYVQDSTIRQKEVEIILRSEDAIMVRGITPSDQVIIQGLNSLSPGQKAAIIKS